ncbi:hypothetical protein [uncultured Methylobacterium sp.]|uniref:hypothetical protein n=1 Tax=uncultured Methylobacterium sp. TaxID=157278 RepID=UPI0035CC773B
MPRKRPLHPRAGLAATALLLAGLAGAAGLARVDPHLVALASASAQGDKTPAR